MPYGRSGAAWSGFTSPVVRPRDIPPPIGGHMAMIDLREFGAGSSKSPAVNRAAIMAARDIARDRNLGLLVPEVLDLEKPALGTFASLDFFGYNDMVIDGGGKGGFRMVGSGMNQDWIGLWLRGCENITLQNLIVDGNNANLSDLDEQTHTVRIGNPDTTRGKTRNIKLYNVTLTRSHGGGAQIMGAGNFDGFQTENIWMDDCYVYNNKRSGIDVQRVIGDVLIDSTLFEGGDQSTDQLLDLEPTGVASSSPRRLLVRGCVFRHVTNTNAITLWGIRDGNLLTDVVLSDCVVENGRVSLQDVNGVTLHHVVVRCSPTETSSAPVIDVNSLSRNVRITECDLYRPATAFPGYMLHGDYTSATGCPDGWYVEGNRMHQYTDDAFTYIQAARDASYRRNKHYYYGPSTAKTAVAFTTIARTCKGIDISDNEFYANLGPLGDGVGGGTMACGVKVLSNLHAMDRPRINRNSFEGFTSHVDFLTSNGGAITGIPQVMGNVGDGADFGLNAFTYAPVIQIGGNQGSGGAADYIGTGVPSFVAGRGSSYRRRGAAGTYVNETGTSTWRQL